MEEELVHLLGGGLMSMPQDAEEAEDVDLKEGIGNLSNVILGVRGGDEGAENNAQRLGELNQGQESSGEWSCREKGTFCRTATRCSGFFTISDMRETPAITTA